MFLFSPYLQNQELKALQDVETIGILLREKEVLLQKKEDELFNADEKIAQLECELDEERTRSAKLNQELSSIAEEKQNLTKQCQTVAKEKIELALKFRLEKSKVSFQTTLICKFAIF